MELELEASAVVLAVLVRVAMTLYAVGAVRARSAAAVAVRSGVELAVAVVVCAAIAAVAGPERSGLFSTVLPCAVLAAAMFGVATAERSRVRVVVILTVLTGVALAGLVLTDQTGSDATVTLAGVVAASLGALLAAAAIGGRAGKFNRDGSTNVLPSHNVPLMSVGAVLLPTLLAAVATPGVSPMFGVVAGLTAASLSLLAAGAVYAARGVRLDPTTAFAVAAGGGVCGGLLLYPDAAEVWILPPLLGLVLPWCVRKLEMRFRVDDPSGLALPVALGAIAGAIGRGVMMNRIGNDVWPELLIGLGVGVSIAVAMGLAVLTLRQLGQARVSPAEEADGLDLAVHDVNAYPDFQQTMIKSYHLRQ